MPPRHNLGSRVWESRGAILAPRRRAGTKPRLRIAGARWGRRGRRIRAAAHIVAIVALLGGCWRQSYEKVLGVHVDVLVSLAEKLCELAEAQRRPAAEEMGEFVYPLRRARQFQRHFARDAGRASFRLFDQLLAGYDALVQRVDAARATPESWKRERDAVCAGRDGIRARASSIREALWQEAGNG